MVVWLQRSRKVVEVVEVSSTRVGTIGLGWIHHLHLYLLCWSLVRCRHLHPLHPVSSRLLRLLWRI